jgi:fumarate hydratase subunit beta
MPVGSLSAAREIVRITVPLNDDICHQLKSGQDVLISGTIYTMRDAAHARICRLMESGEEIPFDIKGAVIYYAGASPTPPGMVIGSIGPTTSGRMDVYTPPLLDAGLKGMIGKGPRSKTVREAIKKHRAVYFGAVGGLGAFLSQKVVSSQLTTFAELGPEAIYRLEVKDFPAKVLIDSHGEDYYDTLE